MSEKILIAHTPDDERRTMCSVLREQGYFVRQCAGTSSLLEALEDSPAVLLLDAALSGNDRAEYWDEVAKFCTQRETACLVFSTMGEPSSSIRERLPWAMGVVHHPNDVDELAARVGDLVRIRRLGHELGLAHDMLQRKQREYNESLRAAAQIQKNLLPQRLPKVDTLSFAYRFLPCEQVGGDLFNVMRLDEKTLMAYLFDVSGHGVSAAMVSVSVSQSLSPHSGRIVKQRIESDPHYRIPAPAEVMASLEKEFPFERFENFFTITYLLIDIETGRVRYCNAGHPPPVLLKADGSLETLDEGGGLIGIEGLGSFNEGEISMQPGDRLYLYSDGITEHSNSRLELFGEQRFFRKVQELKKRDLDSVCEKTIEALHAFGRAQPIKDDITLLGIEYRGRSL
ncbi:MAG: SpoIIE family protein phosphatase [Thermodesulfobacteriota bacterium]|jgi:sigma-B regulation protein RsbU (phosphoserine phosphatase)|nr:SpoIIE family protein phosphatase [Thermodesulfobacteriota bacterium]